MLLLISGILNIKISLYGFIHRTAFQSSVIVDQRMSICCVVSLFNKHYSNYLCWYIMLRKTSNLFIDSLFGHDHKINIQ